MRIARLGRQSNPLNFKAEEGNQRRLTRLPSTTFDDNLKTHQSAVECPGCSKAIICNPVFHDRLTDDASLLESERYEVPPVAPAPVTY